MNERIKRLRAKLAEPLLVTTPTNVEYLAGFRSSNAALLVEQDRVRLFADFRYADAGRSVADVEFVETERALMKGLARRLSGPIAFEPSSVTYAGYEELRGGGLELIPRAGLVESLRAVKDAQELAAIRRACSIANRVYERLAAEPFTGRTERDVAWTIEQLFHDEGADAIAFELVVASGPNAARPHSRAGARVIQRGETVVVDAGCRIDGYCSDYTRTFATGPLQDELKEAYRVCAEAQQAGLEAVLAGVPGVDVDAQARRIVDESKFRGMFGHGLGHGIGLDVHEAPRLSQESTDTLAPGNVVTVEPGVYVAGRGGIRIEDNVLLTEDGSENLTSVRKDLVTVE